MDVLTACLSVLLSIGSEMFRSKLGRCAGNLLFFSLCFCTSPNLVCRMQKDGDNADAPSCHFLLVLAPIHSLTNDKRCGCHFDILLTRSHTPLLSLPLPNTPHRYYTPSFSFSFFLFCTRVERMREDCKLNANDGSEFFVKRTYCTFSSVAGCRSKTTAIHSCNDGIDSSLLFALL